MTNGTEVAKFFWYDIPHKAAARDGQTMLRFNSLWYILLTFLSPQTERTQYYELLLNFTNITLQQEANSAFIAYGVF